MNLKFSPVVEAKEAGHSGNFSAFRIDLKSLGRFIAPVMGLDLYRMSGPTFAPHPHAGFSAVSYVFEDSTGGLRNRDSLGNDLVVEPGDLLWTQAGRGVVHDEFPANNGSTVHGVQLFVNMRSKHKGLPPQMFKVSAGEVPVAQDEAGNRIRVLSGQLGDLRSPIRPVEPFDFFDARLEKTWKHAIRGGWNVMVFVLSGSVAIDGLVIGERQTLGVQSDGNGDELLIEPTPGAHILWLSGRDPNEPIAAYGPFIMNTEAEIAQAYERYRAGEMGSIGPAEKKL
jgi:redox-sensitive bicupin YhaK (pirin superfamily)